MSSASQIIGLAAGWSAVGWVFAQALLLGIRTWRARARQQRELVERRAEFRRQIEATARAARATKSIADWQGWRPFRVAAVVDEAIAVKSFYLTPVDGRPLAPFLPGQYLTFQLRLPGGERLVRCYSLSDRPREDYFRVTIKRVAPPAGRPDLPPGRGSAFFHDGVGVGDVLDVRAPAGTFLVDPHASEPIALVGSGIGITPLVSMLDSIVHAGREREVHVLFGFRNGREQPFREHLQRLAQRHANIRLHVSYSAPRPEDALHRDYNHRGRVTMERLRDSLPSNNFRFYVCGPGQMMEQLVPALWAWGVPESHVHFEAFGPASVRRLCGAGAEGPLAAPCSVRFERTGRVATWDDSCGSLLEFGESAGVALPSGCRAGNCGECLTAVRSGTTRPLKPPGIPVPAGHCLTCITVPASELVLDA